MVKEVFNRCEKKYILNTETYKELILQIEPFVKGDSYNTGGKPYTICNIYYDNENNELIQKSLEKPIYKEKLRLRGYGVPNPTDRVFIEVKKKYNGMVNKRRVALNLKDACEFLDNKTRPSVEGFRKNQVLNEIEYLIGIYGLVPKVYLAYDRFAFYDINNPKFRISFDNNIRTRRYDLQLQLGDYGKSLIDEDLRIMEIKSEDAIPLWFVNILSDMKIYSNSFSKYGREFMSYINGEDYLNDR